MKFLREYVFHSPIHYGIAFGLNVLLVLLVLFLKGFDRILAYIDAFSVAGSVSVLYGLLMLVTSLGAFNMFGYAFSSFRTERKYKDLYEYTMVKQKKQAGREKTYTPYMIVGVIFLLVSYVLSGFAPTI
ncbi:MAG: DUF3899 domain-containing protein [Lachnospiraceae bacterium]|nr:DUF3899 domain-containing protein [Lachnospiraceae bacterium]